MAKAHYDGFTHPWFSLLGDHWSPILALLAPLYWINDGPFSLIFAQGLLFALAVPPLWLFARRRLGAVAAYLVSVAYVVSWPIAQAVEFDFHEVAFAPVLIAWMVERHDAGRTRTALVMGGLLLLTKEDMGLVVAGFGLCLLARGAFRSGALLVAGGVAAVLVATKVLIPFFGGRDGFYWRYEDLGDGPASALVHVLTHLARDAGAARPAVGQAGHDGLAAADRAGGVPAVAAGPAVAAAAGRAHAVVVSPLGGASRSTTTRSW